MMATVIRMFQNVVHLDQFDDMMMTLIFMMIMTILFPIKTFYNSTIEMEGGKSRVLIVSFPFDLMMIIKMIMRRKMPLMMIMMTMMIMMIMMTMMTMMMMMMRGAGAGSPFLISSLYLAFAQPQSPGYYLQIYICLDE